MNKPLQFITVRRIFRDSADTSSLAIHGRTQKPGTLGVTGNLEHGASICPASEADRLALIAFLESDECKEASK
jgi:hypothetical protein